MFRNTHYRGLGVSLLFAVSASCFTMAAQAQVEIGGPIATVSGSYVLPNGTFLPDFYTWGETITFKGSGWFANDTLTVHLVGPLNQPGVSSRNMVLGTILTNSAGKLTSGSNTRLKIPAIQRLNNQPDTLRPGRYQLYATRPAPTPVQPPVTSFPNTINLSPRTIPLQGAFPDFILWAKERGGRDGELEEHSPERTDPEWISVWDENPVAFYATVAETGSDGAHQPAFISHEDFPSTHYAHDVNLLLIPDLEYRWILGDANYNSASDPARNGRIEWEWEVQNSGSPFVGSYGHGNIGVPLFALPTAGDRIFTVGRWAMDNGHPDSGDRTELHPPSMIATVRKRNTALPLAPSGILTRASQVDVYVSGHGGGANMFPDGLSSALNRGMLGGGSLLAGPDVPVDLDTYFAFGPANNGDLSLKILSAYLGFNLDLIKLRAGPSAFGWINGPDTRAINRMNYDFDVPLPAPPVGASKIQVHTFTHPEHTTSVNEVITYTHPNKAGLPTVAHIHLPYQGADNGIYARTLNFFWDTFIPPGNHYRVQFNNLSFFLNSWMTGRTYMWADVCGQWTFLTELNPDAFLNAKTAQIARLNSLHGFDIYLDPTDSLRVFTQGYDQEDFDYLLGKPGDIGQPAYVAAVHLAEATAAAKIRTFDPTTLSSPGDGENVDLTGALFQSQGQPNVNGGTKNFIVDSHPFYFFEDFNVTYIPRPPVLFVTGVPANLGQVNLGATGGVNVQVINRGESPLTITSVTISGAGYTAVPGLPVPFTITAGQVINVNVTFKPTNITQGAGALNIQSNDPLQRSVTYKLTAKVGFPILQVTAATGRTPSLVVGATTRWPVTIANTGTAPLSVKPSISGAGFSFMLPPGYYNPLNGMLFKDIVVPPGGTNTDLTVKFVTPSRQTKFVGPLVLTSNDPVHPTTTLTFGVEGVPVGMRVLVVNANGTPYPNVDEIQLKYKGKSAVNDDLKDVPLTTIDPPASWKRIQYHYMTALAPTASAAGYELRVQVGNKKQTYQFSLASNEFKQIVLTLP